MKSTSVIQFSYIRVFQKVTKTRKIQLKTTLKSTIISIGNFYDLFSMPKSHRNRLPRDLAFCERQVFILRFLHTADLHLGAVPDIGKPWSKERAAAVQNSLRRVLQDAEKRQADLLLIAGDLFHRQPLRKELKELNYQFSRLTRTRVVFIAGNHDYISEASPYRDYPWADNVTFLSSSSLTSVYFADLETEIHGLSYHRPEIREPLFDNCRAPADGRIHILLAHGGDAQHIPFRPSSFSGSGFRYVAMGHIHQPQVYQEIPAAYPGSPEPLDRTDIGPRGYIFGEITSKKTRLDWVPLSAVQYVPLEIPVDASYTTGRILDEIRPQLEKHPQYIYRLHLTGYRDPEITFDREQLESAGRIVEVQDDTEPAFDLEALARDHANDLIGHYIRVLSSSPEDPIRKKALYYGLQALCSTENR